MDYPGRYYPVTLPICGARPSPFVGMGHTPDDEGYWQATADGQVLDSATPSSSGSLNAFSCALPLAGLIPTGDGRATGWWVVTVVSSPLETPGSTARRRGSGLKPPSWAWPPRQTARAIRSSPLTAACSPSATPSSTV